ncbi:hypothetical protein HK098_007154 [Nowakowskiella sp. JEL0407]|nr:hypothetical protein HK098_007154 [Nowakowskiella sp. JEL0407]
MSVEPASNSNTEIPSTPITPTPSGATIVVRVAIPSLSLQKALRTTSTDLVWNLKLQVLEKVAQDIKDALNYGLYLPSKTGNGSGGKFLEEKRDLLYYISENNAVLEFIPKACIKTGQDDTTGEGSPSANSKKKQKRFIEDVQKGFSDKIRDRCQKGLDSNFWTESQESPLSIATMNNDANCISALYENGAFLDYRVGEKDTWKTPLHLAAVHNKLDALVMLLHFGAWVNCKDSLGLTPLWYAATNGNFECVCRLLAAKADTEVFDENGKGPLHQACLNSHENIVSHLIDAGANMNAVNLAGNTPLHIASTRPNSKECLRWLLLRGCDRERCNKTGQSPLQIATMSGNNDAAEMIKNFNSAQIIPPPPKTSDSLYLNMVKDTVKLPNEIKRSISTSSVNGSFKSFQQTTLQIRRQSNLPNEASNITESGSIISLHSPSETLKYSESTLSRSGTRKSKSSTKDERLKKGTSIPPPPRIPRPQSLFPSNLSQSPQHSLKELQPSGDSSSKQKESPSSPTTKKDFPEIKNKNTIEVNPSPSSGNIAASVNDLSPVEIKTTETTNVSSTLNLSALPIQIELSLNSTSTPNLAIKSFPTHQKQSSAASTSSSSATPTTSSPQATAIVMIKNVIASNGSMNATELENLLKSVSTMESMMKSAMERAVRAEMRAKKVEEELLKLKKANSTAIGSMVSLSSVSAVNSSK